MKKSIVEIIPHLKKLAEYEFEILGISSMNEVHLSNDSFTKHFDHYKADYRNSNDYPIELSTTVDGIRFFSLYQIGDFHAIK